MTQPTLDAFGYVRVSGRGQVSGFGPERQRDDITACANRFGYNLLQIHEEQFTGTEFDRPIFMEMIGQMSLDGPKIVIVESLDRLARDLMIQNQILAKLCAEGLTLIAANTGENVTEAIMEDPMRKAMVQMQGVFAEWDKSMLVRRLKRGREAKKRLTGRCCGVIPYGEKPGELRIIKRIAHLFAKFVHVQDERERFKQIAKQINSEGHRTRKGGKFTHHRVRQVFQNNVPKVLGATA